MRNRANLKNLMSTDNLASIGVYEYSSSIAQVPPLHQKRRSHHILSYLI